MNRNLVTVATALLLATTLSSCSLFYPSSSSPTTKTPTKTTTKTPVTPTPKPTPTPTPVVDPSLAKVEISVASADAFISNGTIDVDASALNIMETDGTCTLKVTQGSKSQAVTVKSEPNVNSVHCFPLSLPIDGFTVGSASYNVTYVSSKYAGVLEGTLKIQ